MTTQWYNAGMNPTYVPPLTEQQLAELDELYRKTQVPRLRTRAQMILLSAEKRLKVGEIADIVRESDATVLRWLKRYMAEGVDGLQDAPRPGRERTVTETYHEKLVEAVRRRPRSLDLDFSLWTLQRLADYMAEETGIRVSTETVRRTLKDADIVLSRPQHTISSPDPEYQVKKRRSKMHETT
jgi:transposase